MPATPSNSMNLNSTTAGLANWDGASSMSSTALAQYNVVSGASTSTVNNISPSTSGFVLTSNGLSAQPTFQALPFTKMPWNDQGTSTTAAVNNGYFTTATITLTLPASPAQGDVVAVITDATNVVTVTANTGQFIRTGNVITASAGTAASNKRGDALTLVYRASDTTWLAQDVIGTWTLT